MFGDCFPKSPIDKEVFRASLCLKVVENYGQVPSDQHILEPGPRRQLTMNWGICCNSAFGV